ALFLHSGRLRGIERASGVVPLPAPSGLSLRASLENAGLLFDDEGCREAGGRVRVELAVDDEALPGVILAGSPECAGRKGVLALVPEQASGALQLEASFEVDSDGRYRLQSLARSDDPALRASLLAAGFQQAPGSFSRVDSGSFGDCAGACRLRDAGRRRGPRREPPAAPGGASATPSELELRTQGVLPGLVAGEAVVAAGVVEHEAP